MPSLPRQENLVMVLIDIMMVLDGIGGKSLDFKCHSKDVNIELCHVKESFLLFILLHTDI